MAKDNAIKDLTDEQKTMLEGMTKLRRGMAINTLKGMKPAQAHKKAGGTCKRESQRKDLGNQILANPIVKQFLDSVNQEIAIEAKVDATYVLNRLYEVDNMDALDILNDDGSLKPISQWPRIWRLELSGFEIAEMFEAQKGGKELVGLLKKIKWTDKAKNRELLGKHKAVNAFKEIVEHSGEVTVFNMDFSGGAK